MKRKKIIFILIPIVFALLLGASFILFGKKDNLIDNSTIKHEENYVKRKLYLLSNDNIVVPVTISFDKKEGLADEIYYVLTMLKEDSKVHNNLKGVINKDTSITELIIQDRVITVGFSKEFLNYNIKNELRIVEAIVWTLSQYEEIEAVNLKVENELLTKMPLGKTPLPKDMSKDIGINNHIFPSVLNKKRVVTYYVKTVGDKEMYVPVSNNIDEDAVSVFLELSKTNIPLLYGLKVSSHLNEIEVVSINETEEEIEFCLTTSCLIEEDLVDYDVYHSLQVALSSYKEDCSISISVDGNVLMVDGIQNEESIIVSEVLFNEIII